MKYELALKPEDRVALKKSIKKWKRVVRGRFDMGTFDCALCELYYEPACEGCPVKEWTGDTVCAKSPYRLWLIHQDKHDGYRDYRVKCSTCKKLAQRELDFLKHLLEIGVDW